MHELGTELGRFIGGQIDLVQLRAAISARMRRDPQQRDSIARWLKASVQDGRLSAAVWMSLRDLFDDRVAGEVREPTLSNSDTHPGGLVSRPQSTAHAHPERRSAGWRTQDASQPLQPGSVVKDRFVLVEQLGSGGMGQVFKARDMRREEARDRNPYVALKVLNSEFSAHPDSFIALQREARRAGTLAHPNVVTIYDFDRDGARIYMTMEYLEGRGLDALMRAEWAHGLPIETAMPIIRAVASALDCGHSKRIVHSDLKPGNIFVCRDGVVKVLDFGISRLVRPTDGTGDETVFDPAQRLGGLTPAYASLEMWNRETPDPRDDIYALACVSYELLSGRHPFGKVSAMDAALQNLQPQRPPGLTRTQWHALKRALALRRADRTPSVTSFLQALEPRSALRRYAVPIGVAASVALGAAIVLGMRYYSRYIEDSTLEVLQCAEIPKPVEEVVARAHPALSAEQRRYVDDNLALVALAIGEIDAQTSIETMKSVLSEGPNNALYMLELTRAVDPGNTQAIRARERIAGLYADRARQSLEAGEVEQALDLSRHARAVLPGSQPLFRLEQSICRAEALARNSRKPTGGE